MNWRPASLCVTTLHCRATALIAIVAIWAPTSIQIRKGTAQTENSAQEESIDSQREVALATRLPSNRLTIPDGSTEEIVEFMQALMRRVPQATSLPNEEKSRRDVAHCIE